MDARMAREAWVGDAPTLVVAGDDEDGHARVRHAPERLEGLGDDGVVGSGAVEDVSRVDDEVYLTPEGGLERPAVVGHEVGPAPPPSDPGRDGEVEPEMGVGEEEDT
jgi:hypothetical protein